MTSLRTTSEFVVIGGLVVGAHLALVSPQLETGLESAGDAGVDLLQVMASNASIASLVEAWDQPPEVSVTADIQPPEMLATETLPAQPQPNLDSSTQRPVGAVRMTAMHADAPPLPVVPAAKPPKVAAEAPPQQTVKAAPKVAPQTSPRAVTPRAARPQPPEMMQAATPLKPAQSPPKPMEQPKPQEEKTKPVKKAAATDTIQINARRAAGSGGDTAKGNQGSEQTATKSEAKKKSLLKKWGQQIRNRVARKAPKGVGKGRAVVTFTVAANGTVSNIRLSKSSGNTRIDQAALKSVRSAGKMPKSPKGLAVTSMPMAVPIVSR